MQGMLDFRKRKTNWEIKSFEIKARTFYEYKNKIKLST